MTDNQQNKENKTTKFDYLFKYIIIGQQAVGKSNLLLRYINGEFRNEYQTTIGVEFGSKSLFIKDKVYRIQIWDTAGQENYKSITRAYYKNSACAIIVYDISNRESFENVSSWIEDCKNQCAKTVYMTLVGNKSDLEEMRVVSKEEGQELAEKYGINFYETSAKTGENVEELFNNSAEEIIANIEAGYYDLEDESNGIKTGFNELMNKKQLHSEITENPYKKKCC